MKYEEIIEALECCLFDTGRCENCPARVECESSPWETSFEMLARHALTLINNINNLMAEIEQLKAERKQ